jgi:hypothetical protein
MLLWTGTEQPVEEAPVRAKARVGHPVPTLLIIIIIITTTHHLCHLGPLEHYTATTVLTAPVGELCRIVPWCARIVARVHLLN